MTQKKTELDIGAIKVQYFCGGVVLIAVVSLIYFLLIFVPESHLVCEDKITQAHINQYKIGQELCNQEHPDRVSLDQVAFIEASLNISNVDAWKQGSWQCDKWGNETSGIVEIELRDITLEKKIEVETVALGNGCTCDVYSATGESWNIHCHDCIKKNCLHETWGRDISKVKNMIDPELYQTYTP